MRETICQCLKCGNVFSWGEKKNCSCPKCEGKFTIIKFSNFSDEIYINKLSIKFSE